MHLDILCSLTKFCEKKIFCVFCVKKTKKLSLEKLFWSTKNCVFYIGHKKCHFFAILCV
jgi:hypothetical protein